MKKETHDAAHLNSTRPKLTAFMLPALLFTVAASLFGTRVMAENELDFWVKIAFNHVTAFALFLTGVVYCFGLVEDYIRSNDPSHTAAPAGRVDSVVWQED